MAVGDSEPLCDLNQTCANDEISECESTTPRSISADMRCFGCGPGCEGRFEIFLNVVAVKRVYIGHARYPGIG